MRKEYENFAESTLMEGMTSIRAVIEAMRSQPSYTRKIVSVIYDKNKEVSNAKTLKWLRYRAEELGFEIEHADSDFFASVCTGNTHGGIIAYTTERRLPELKCATDIVPNGFYIMIEGVEDPYNFGYALRSLYAMGVSGIVLPPRNWMSAGGVVARSSAGASELLKMYSSTAEECISFFRSKGYIVICADIDTEYSLQSTSLPCPLLLIVGGEKRGISASIKSKVDKVVKIDYGREFSNSLSTASAVTILAYEIAKQNRDKLI